MKKKQDRKCTYNLTLSLVRITTAAIKMKGVLCIVDIHVTVNNIKILSAAQKCFYGEIMPPE